MRSGSGPAIRPAHSGSSSQVHVLDCCMHAAAAQHRAGRGSVASPPQLELPSLYRPNPAPPCQVLGLLPLQLAAYKALANERRGKMISKTLHTELVYNLSGSRHVGVLAAECAASKRADGCRLGLVWAVPRVHDSRCAIARRQTSWCKRQIAGRVWVCLCTPLLAAHCSCPTTAPGLEAGPALTPAAPTLLFPPQIGESLRRFGMQDDTASLLVARIGATPADVRVPRQASGPASPSCALNTCCGRR